MKNKKRRFRFRLTIGNKILAGFLAVMVLFVINATIIFLTGNQIDNVVSKSAEVVRPSKDAINEFVLTVERYQKLITSWVYLQTNDENKNALKLLVSHEYPALKERIEALKNTWEIDSQKVLVDTVFASFERVQRYAEDQITSQLISFESYEDGITKLLAEDVLESTINPQLEEILVDLKGLAHAQTTINTISDAELINSSKNLRNITLILAGITILLGLVSAYLLMRAITRPVNFLKDVVVKLGKGELVEDKQTKFSNDEIGEMATAMDNLVNGLKATTHFAENIGKGNYSSDFKPLSEHDVLGNALINMRNNLARVAEDDAKRNWATEGLAKFGEILRTNTNDLEKLADEIISNLVKYLKSNQGALYIMDDESGDEPTMSMKACYAWDKKKFIDHKIHKGEGLAGQAWQEGDTVYLTEVPQNYIKISSGLGDANPTAILIVPLKVNEQIFGVVEIASFNTFADYEMEFVQKIAESIASTISSVKINARTQRLLEESQEMTEQMRAQEEEMRQNMEELQATQEEMQRNQSETEGTMQALNTSLAMAEYDVEGKLVKINTNYLSILGYSQNEVVGEHHRIFVSKEEKNSEEYRQFWRDLEAGKARKGVFKRLSRKGDAVNIRSYFSPVKGRAGEILRIMEISVEA
ncbi:MAG: GAF domain-containing protein [Cyclobacteriaceae bacterium]|nr:GAF domain-containing protein [Cyclobacteriaceae bacterium]UYN88423.1 MAG: GAF domain-containing protein [Cyclobacteriaceae bacterium]